MVRSAFVGRSLVAEGTTRRKALVGRIFYSLGLAWTGTKQLRRATITALALSILGLISRGVCQAQSPLGAGISLKLAISGSSSVQGADDGGDPMDKISAPTKITISAKDILALAAASPNSTAGGSYSSDAELWVDGKSWDVEVLDSAGNLEDDLTADGILSVVFDPNGNGVWSGTTNNSTSAMQYKGHYSIWINFDDGNGNFAFLTGMGKESFSFSAAKINTDSQNAKDSFSVKTIGDGVYTAAGNQANATFALTLSGKNKASVDPDE